MFLIAHRGSSHKYGDNNIISFRKALEEGFDMIELDIQLCATGDIVIHHDTFIDNKYIENMELKEIEYYGILLLDEFLSEFHDKNISIFLDIKGSHMVCFPLLELLNKWFSSESIKKVYVSGFNRYFVDFIAESNLNINIGFTTDNSYPIEQLNSLIDKCSFVCLHWTTLDHETIKYLQQQGILVFSFTCENKFILNHMNKFKLDGIVTNHFIPLALYSN
jgi:glycerophosphoryl diester phosphodiesterase